MSILLSKPIIITQATRYDIESAALDITNLVLSVGVSLLDDTGNVVGAKRITINIADVLSGLNVSAQQLQNALLNQLKVAGVIN